MHETFTKDGLFIRMLFSHQGGLNERFSYWDIGFPDSFGRDSTRITTFFGVPQTDEFFGNVGSLGTILVLLKGTITNKLSPEAMLDRYIFYFVDEGIIEYFCFDFDSKKDWHKDWEDAHCQIRVGFFPNGVNNHVSLEWDFQAILVGDFGQPLDDVTRTNFVPFNLDKGRSALLIKHVANEADESTFIYLDRSGLKNEANILPPCNKEQDGNLIIVNVSKFLYHPRNQSICIDCQHRLRMGVATHFSCAAMKN